MKRKLLALALLVATVLTLAPAVMAEEDGPLTPYDPVIEILTPGGYSPNMFFAEGESYEDNFVTRFYEEKLGTRYSPKWMVDSSQGTQTLDLAIATNDLPDMFQVNALTLAKLHAADQIEDITDLIEKYATDDLLAILNYQDGRGFLTATFDGRVFGLPISNDFANNLPMMYYRKDWLDTLGKDVPVTLEDMLDVARAMRDNIEGCTVPYALEGEYLGWSGTEFKAIANANNAYYDCWIPDGNGGLIFRNVAPEMKDALKTLQDMYAEGLLDPEFGVRDQGKIAEDVAAGKVGIFAGVFWNPLWPLAGSLENDPEADWVAAPIMTNKDGVLKPQNTIFAYDWVVVRKGFEHPEALLKSMNFWFECFHGQYADQLNDLLSTEKYMPAADNWHGNGKPVFFSHPEKNLRLSDNYMEARQANDPSLLKTGEARNRWEIWQAGGPQGWAHATFLMVAEPVLHAYTDVQYNEYLGAPTETMMLREANLIKLTKETFVKIIMGESIDAFDSYVEKWNDQGGAQITEEVNAWYQSVQ